MYNFVNNNLKNDIYEIIKNGWVPLKGKVSGNSIEFDAQHKIGF